MAKKQWIFIKLLLIALFAWWIFVQVTQYASQINTHKWQIPNPNILYLLLTVLFVPVNWFLEAMKWKILCAPYVILTTVQSIKSVLVGLTAGLITPGRVGEYVGRIAATNGAPTSALIIATFLGSISQNLWNISIGLLLAIPIIHKIFHSGDHPYFYIIAVVQAALLIIVFFNISTIIKYIKKIDFLKKYRNYIDRYGEIYNYKFKDLFSVLIISGSRYCLYFAQYTFILWTFGVQLNISAIFVGVGTVYLIQSIVPLPSFISVMARGELAILVWGVFDTPPLIAIIVSFSLWIINLIIPALFGVFIVIKSEKLSLQKSKYDSHV